MAFEQIPDHAKVWIYQSNRKLQADEVSWLKNTAQNFIQTWAAHGKSLQAEADVLHNYFLIIMVDEAQAKASGCSIDASVQFVREAQNKLNTDFFQRFHITYRNDSAQAVQSADREEFEKLLENGSVHDQTLVFNNLVSTKKEWETEWEIPFKDSWHANYFSKVS